MALVIGSLLFVLGLVTFVGWWPDTFFFLKGLVSISLLFWGLMALLVGYSERKAKREFKNAVDDEKEEVAPKEKEASQETSPTLPAA